MKNKAKRANERCAVGFSVSREKCKKVRLSLLHATVFEYWLFVIGL